MIKLKQKPVEEIVAGRNCAEHAFDKARV